MITRMVAAIVSSLTDDFLQQFPLAAALPPGGAILFPRPFPLLPFFVLGLLNLSVRFVIIVVFVVILLVGREIRR